MDTQSFSSEQEGTMEIAISLLLLTILVWIVLFVRKTMKEEQKRRLEEQKRKAEEQRIAVLQKVGENIHTTVRYADEHSMRTEGRHPDTGKPLSFTGVRGLGQKQYSPGDLVFVLVNLKDLSNYQIRWDREPEPSVLANKPGRLNISRGQIDDDALPVINNRIRWSNDLSPLYNAHQLKKNRRLLEDDEPLLLSNMPSMIRNRWLLDEDAAHITKRGKQRYPRLKKQKCFFCQGKGTLTTRCTQCSGRGRKRKVEYELGRKRVSKEVCSACYGSGKFSHPCHYCDGK